MRNQFVIVNFDLLCEWTKVPPVYRVYVNHEIFTERTFRWGMDQYIKEAISMDAPPGTYVIRLENLDDSSTFKIRNLTVAKGNATVVDSKTFEITA
jgi:hypothetical protein